MTRIVFMGTPDFATPILEAMIKEDYHVVGAVSQPDRPVGRKRTLTPTPVKQKALDYQIPIFQPEKIKEDYQQVLDWEPDLIVTAAFGQIIPKVLLDAPKLGCINVHASLLPKYRGGAPIHQAIIDGEKETGVTIMYMDVTMDTGDIISQNRIPIELTDDVGALFEKLSILGANLLIETLPKLVAGTADRIPQDEALATYAYNIKREQELLNWSKPARVIFDHIRGLHPWPVAYTTLDDLSIKIFKAIVMNHHLEHEAGIIAHVSNDGIDVVCGDGQMLRLLDIQVAGKKRLAMKDLLNGSHPFEVGKSFKGTNLK